MTSFMQALTEALPGWEIEPVAEGNLTQGLEILASNREGYYALTGEPAPTLQNLREDLTHLPPGRSLCDKSFLLLSFDGKATALMDYVRGYPTEQTGYIGLLILHQNCHRPRPLSRPPAKPAPGGWNLAALRPTRRGFLSGAPTALRFSAAASTQTNRELPREIPDAYWCWKKTYNFLKNAIDKSRRISYNSGAVSNSICARSSAG